MTETIVKEKEIKQQVNQEAEQQPHVETVAEIRVNWKKADAIRDAGLVTPDDIERHDNISYGPYGEENLLDVYHKKEVTGLQPVIISVHGGGWVYGCKELYQFYGMRLAQRGFTVVNFNYRLAPESLFPAQLTDINRVFAFVEEHGAEYHIDTNHVFVVGDSAGAQLAYHYLTICTNADFAARFPFQTTHLKVKAVALNCGIYDVLQPDRIYLVKQYAGQDLMDDTAEAAGRRESLTVSKYVTKDFPPAFVMTAACDYMRPKALPLYEELRTAGVECEYHRYGHDKKPEIGHVFHVNCKLAEADRCNDEECNFFRRYM